MRSVNCLATMTLVSELRQLSRCRLCKAKAPSLAELPFSRVMAVGYRRSEWLFRGKLSLSASSGLPPFSGKRDECEEVCLPIETRH